MMLQAFAMLWAAGRVCGLLAPSTSTRPRLSSLALSKSPQQPSSTDSNEALVADLLATARQLRLEASELEASLLDEAATEDLDHFFDIADVNHDGHVTLEGLRAALRKRLVECNSDEGDRIKAETLLASKDRLATVMRDLDLDHDGTLERDEWISSGEFRQRLERLVKDEKVPTHPAILRQRYIDERIAHFEERANRSTATDKAIAAVCYALPALEVATMAAPHVPAPLLQASVYYHSISMSGLILLIGLFNVAIDYRVPRGVRFAARHACILDLLGALLVPPAMQLLLPLDTTLCPTALEVLVVACAAAALAGRDATFAPFTGQLAGKLTSDCDEQIKNAVRQAAVINFADRHADTATDGHGKSKKPETSAGFFRRLLDAFYKEAGIDRKKDEEDDAM